MKKVIIISLLLASVNVMAGSFFGPVDVTINAIEAPLGTTVEHLSKDEEGINQLGFTSGVSLDGKWVVYSTAALPNGEELEPLFNPTEFPKGYIFNTITEQKIDLVDFSDEHGLSNSTILLPIEGDTIIAIESAGFESFEHKVIDLNSGSAVSVNAEDVLHGLDPFSVPDSSVLPSSDYTKFAFLSASNGIDNDDLVDLYISDVESGLLTRIPMGLSADEEAFFQASPELKYFLVGNIGIEGVILNSLKRVSNNADIRTISDLATIADDLLVSTFTLISDDGENIALTVLRDGEQFSRIIHYDLINNSVIKEYTANQYPLLTPVQNFLDSQSQGLFLNSISGRYVFPEITSFVNIAADADEQRPIFRLRQTAYYVAANTNNALSFNQDYLGALGLMFSSISRDSRTIVANSVASLVSADEDEATFQGRAVKMSDAYLIRTNLFNTINSGLVATPESLLINTANTSSTNVDLLLNAQDLFAIEVECTTSNDNLSLNSRAAGSVFPAAPQSLLVDTTKLNENTFAQATSLSAYVDDSGAFVAAPEPITASGVYASLVYNVQPVSGTTDVNCTAMGSDADGLPQTVSVTNATITLDNGINPVDGNGQVVSGTVIVPTGVDPASIVVTLTINDVSVTTTVDATGVFEFENIRMDDVTISVEAPNAVAECTAATVGSEAVSTGDITVYRGDINKDGVIDIADFTFLSSRFGLSEGENRYKAKADLNKDGVINVQDLAILGSALGIAACDPLN